MNPPEGTGKDREEARWRQRNSEMEMHRSGERKLRKNDEQESSANKNSPLEH